MTTSAQQLYDEAVALHRAGQLQQAELCYRELLRAHPQHAECLHLLGALLVQCHGARQVSASGEVVARSMLALLLPASC
jgi:Flp pilus assembly protein TadD